MARPGRPVRLELNAQRVTEAMDFYRGLFGWTTRPLHVPPWGSIPEILNGDRVFANQFMAMGAFAQPKWMIWFSADLEKAKAAVDRAGGDAGQGIYRLGDLGHLLDASDATGTGISAIRMTKTIPETDAPGDPCLAEFWGRNVLGFSRFCADVLGLEYLETSLGAKLMDEDAPRIFFRDVDFDLPRPICVPYFRSTSVGGDCERARRAGAIVQVHQSGVEGMGELVVLSDPAGAYFGLVDPSKAM